MYKEACRQAGVWLYQPIWNYAKTVNNNIKTWNQMQLNIGPMIQQIKGHKNFPIWSPTSSTSRKGIHLMFRYLGNPIAEIHMLDHSFTLPRILAKAANEGLVWKKLSGGINQAKLNIDTETQCEFIYMSPGSQTPMHKHQGNEITLVLDGSFSDASGTYEPADFIVRSGKDEHQPISEEGCLCFAVLDSPLTFTKGIARLFNPVNRYRFRNTIVQKP
jgi:hypothetical protein